MSLTMENEENKIKKGTILGVVLILAFILGLEVSFSLAKKSNPFNFSSKTKVLPTLAPNGTLKTPIKEKALKSGTFPLIISDKGFSQKLTAMEKGSALLLINTSSRTVEISETDANDNPLKTYKIEAGKSNLPIVKTSSGIYKFKDDKGNIFVLSIL